MCIGFGDRVKDDMTVHKTELPQLPPAQPDCSRRHSQERYRAPTGAPDALPLQNVGRYHKWLHPVGLKALEYPVL
jgi:hypothetical protein